MRRSLKYYRSRRGEAVPNAPLPPTFEDITDTTATVRWTAGDSAAATYLLERSLNQTTWTAVYTGTSLSFAATALTVSTVYYYRLSATTTGGTSLPSVTSSMTTQGTPVVAPGVPAAPLVTANTDTSVTLAWDAVATATTYTLSRSLTTGIGFADVVTQAGRTYVNTGLAAATAYFYRLTATNAAGTSAVSPETTITTDAAGTIPTVPGVPAASAITDTSALLTWTASSGATAYTLQRSTAPTTGFVTIASPSSPSFTSTGLTPATTYYFKVNAVGPGGSSAYTATRTVLTGNTQVGNYQPLSSQATWGKWGVCVHPNFNTGSYADKDAFMSLVAGLGASTIRGAYNYDNAGCVETARLCAVYGLRWIMEVVPEGTTSGNPTDQTLAVTKAKVVAIRDTPAVAAICAAIEGINEPNHNRGTTLPVLDTWAQITVDHQREIWNAAKVGTSLANTIIQGPSLHDSAAQNSYTQTAPSGGKYHFDQLKNAGILAYQEAAGMHSYPGGDIPVTNLATRLNYCRTAYGLRDGLPYPISLTEWGYQNYTADTSGGAQWISEAAMSTYDARGLLLLVGQQGLTAMRYEALDDPVVGTDNVQNHFGLWRTPSLSPTTWTAKPSVAKIAAILAKLQDPGAAYVPAKIALTVNKGTAGDVTYVVTAKRDGTATLWIWRDLPVWNKTTKTAITVAPAVVTVTDRAGPRDITVNAEVLAVSLR